MAPLIDPGGLDATLLDRLPPGAPSPERVQELLDEFLRVLGLLPVVVGHGDHVVAARGAEFLRDLLVDLMQEDASLPEPHGAPHLNWLLPPENLAALAALPRASADRPDVEAHLATARAFPARGAWPATSASPGPRPSRPRRRGTSKRNWGCGSSWGEAGVEAVDLRQTWVLVATSTHACRQPSPPDHLSP